MADDAAIDDLLAILGDRLDALLEGAARLVRSVPKIPAFDPRKSFVDALRHVLYAFISNKLAMGSRKLEVEARPFVKVTPRFAGVAKMGTKLRGCGENHSPFELCPRQIAPPRPFASFLDRCKEPRKVRLVQKRWLQRALADSYPSAKVSPATSDHSTE